MKNKFLTIFNQFYKYANLLQIEVARVEVKPGIHCDKKGSRIKCMTLLKAYNVNVKIS